VSATLRSLAFGQRPARTFARVVVLVAVSYVVFGWWFLPLRGEGISMQPTFGSGQIGFVNTLAYNLSPPRRGDIVGIRMAGRRVMYVKRIVGLPGERMAIRGGVVYVNDAPLHEPYAAKGPAWDMTGRTLGAGQYFVIGDNRRMRIEDHDLGIAVRERIVGKMLF
jgi:signal peptidase I